MKDEGHTPFDYRWLNENISWECELCGEHISFHKDTCSEVDLESVDRFVARAKCPVDGCDGLMEESVAHNFQCYTCKSVFSDGPTKEMLLGNDPVKYYFIKDTFGAKHKLVQVNAPYTMPLRTFYFDRIVGDIEILQKQRELSVTKF